MKQLKIQQLLESMRSADEQLQTLSVHKRTLLEKVWDVEHAYYSSVLEGSQLDREEFEQLAKNVA